MGATPQSGVRMACADQKYNARQVIMGRTRSLWGACASPCTPLRGVAPTKKGRPIERWVRSVAASCPPAAGADKNVCPTREYGCHTRGIWLPHHLGFNASVSYKQCDAVGLPRPRVLHAAWLHTPDSCPRTSALFHLPQRQVCGWRGDPGTSGRG